MVPHKYEEYRGIRVYNGDCDLVVDVLIHRVNEDDSGLTFAEWDPSEDTDVSQVPVSMIVNSNQLCDVDFDLREEVIPLPVWVPGGMHSPWIMTMSSGHDMSDASRKPQENH